MSYLPRAIRAGTTFSLSILLSSYPADAGWVASICLRGPSKQDLLATADGPKHIFLVSAEDTAEYAHGRYWYALRVQKDGVIYQIEDGTLEVQRDLSGIDSETFDGRDHVRKVLDAIEAVIEGRASLDQERYTINNRQLQRTPIADLLRLRDKYKDELKRQEAAKKNGAAPFGRPVYIRLS